MNVGFTPKKTLLQIRFRFSFYFFFCLFFYSMQLSSEFLMILFYFLLLFLSLFLHFGRWMDRGHLIRVGFLTHTHRFYRWIEQNFMPVSCVGHDCHIYFLTAPYFIRHNRMTKQNGEKRRRMNHRTNETKLKKKIYSRNQGVIENHSTNE